MTTIHYAGTRERWDGALTRGGVVDVPPTVTQFYDEPAQVLIAEVGAIRDNLTTAKQERADAEAAAQAGPPAYRDALAKAARAGETLPADPTVALQAAVTEASNKVDGLTMAGRAASSELADVLDADGDAAPKALAEARKAVAKVAPLIEKALAAMAVADEKWTTAVWCGQPTFSPRPGGQAGTVTGVLQQALRDTQRLAKVEE
jgi:hypothetical protein